MTKVKWVSILKDRRCHVCNKLIKKEELRKTLSTGLNWFCGWTCYNEWEAKVKHMEMR